MKNKKIIILILAVGIISLSGIISFVPSYSSDTSITSSVSDSTVTKTYTCPMHPEVISDKPGECPKCGMDLILKEDGKKQDEKTYESHKHKGHKGCMGH